MNMLSSWKYVSGKENNSLFMQKVGVLCYVVIIWLYAVMME